MNETNPMKQPWWDRSTFARRRQNLAIRADVMAAVRRYFADQGFMEVETPALQVSPGLDRHIKPMGTEVSGPFDARAVPRYLHTSPEYAMKKLLAAGETSIFQICHVFRNGEESKIHHPEFTLLEWYRADADYTTLMSDVEGLLSAVAAAAGVSQFQHGHFSCDVDILWSRLTVADAFSQFVAIDVLATVGDTLDPIETPLIGAARRSGVRCDNNDSWDDVFHRILLEKIYPALRQEPALFLIDYPAPVGALARRNPDDPRVCERVEAYVCGIEIANGFSELTDPVEQRSRFEQEQALYASLHGKPPPIDEDFLSALGIMPPAAGMALGLDRLVMLLTGADHIRDVLWAPVDLSDP